MGGIRTEQGAVQFPDDTVIILFLLTIHHDKLFVAFHSYISQPLRILAEDRHKNGIVPLAYQAVMDDMPFGALLGYVGQMLRIRAEERGIFADTVKLRRYSAILDDGKLFFLRAIKAFGLNRGLSSGNGIYISQSVCMSPREVVFRPALAPPRRQSRVKCQDNQEK